MANKKIFGYVASVSDFESLKIACDSTNETYWENGVETYGTPDIRFEQIAFIDEDKLIWTHGKYYRSNSLIKEVKTISSETTETLSPNIYYKYTINSSNDVEFTLPTSPNGLQNTYTLDITVGDGVYPTVIFPASIKWIGNPDFEPNGRYLIYIMNGVDNLPIGYFGSATTAKVVLPVVNFICNEAIGTTISSNSNDRTWTIVDTKGNDVDVNMVAGRSSWSVTSSTTSSLLTWEVDGVTYTYSPVYRLYMQSGSTSQRCVQVTLTGPCKITCVASGTRTNAAFYVYVDNTALSTSFCRITTANIPIVDSITYTGTGGTLKIYVSGNYNMYMHQLKIDYNVEVG